MDSKETQTKGPLPQGEGRGEGANKLLQALIRFKRQIREGSYG
jgi:hypothetical protein